MQIVVLLIAAWCYSSPIRWAEHRERELGARQKLPRSGQETHDPDWYSKSKFVDGVHSLKGCGTDCFCKSVRGHLAMLGGTTLPRRVEVNTNFDIVMTETGAYIISDGGWPVAVRHLVLHPSIACRRFTNQRRLQPIQLLAISVSRQRVAGLSSKACTRNSAAVLAALDVGSARANANLRARVEVAITKV